MSEQKKLSDFEKIVEIQKEVGSVKKGSDNPYFKSKYASLDEILEKVKPIVNSYGLYLEQSIHNGIVISAIKSEKGTVIDSSLKIPELVDMQKIGSAITYARRYTLKALLAIADEDDDGNSVSNAQYKTNPNDLGSYYIKVLDKSLNGKDLGQLTDKELEQVKSKLSYWSAKKEEGSEIKGALKDDLTAAYRFINGK